MKKLLLLNPPYKKVVLRDYFCSKISKSSFYYQPVDLVYISGFLSPHFDLHVLDCIAEKLDDQSSFSRIKECNPDIIVFLISSASYSSDMAFLNQLKVEHPQVEFVGAGDVYRELKEKAFEAQPFLDAFFLDFSTNQLVQYFHRTDDAPIENVYFKTKNGIVGGGEAHPGKLPCVMPVPRWDLFPVEKYSFPFSIKKHFASVLTDFGCAYTCTFCPIGTLGFKIRPMETVLEELRLLRKLGVRELLLRDQTFGVDKKRTFELLEHMMQPEYGFSWTAYSRVDVLTEELIIKMKQAGCHMVMFGIETQSERDLKNFQKNMKTSSVGKTIQLCRKHGLNTGGWFILGFPEETKEDINNTIDFAIKSDVDYAVFNILTPRLGTVFREKCLKGEYINHDTLENDSSFGVADIKGRNINKKELKDLQRMAYLRFYLRPRFVIHFLSRLQSMHQLMTVLKNGLNLFSNYSKTAPAASSKLPLEKESNLTSKVSV